ncbi:Transformer-2 protein alpha [Coemansia interrupta]|uniref:Transformer-2 protein alpha n=1 Tax=Coemansia interrupta TaxID=1126814 RepID=A0A9W8H8I0_9FUNG|nr:Transformer-2 protein alpha [Coemansia interrupta]
MSQDNPILPSEPLALEPDLLAAAVQAEELLGYADRNPETHSLSPSRASKVRRRLDNRHFGRSESRERHSEHEGREDTRRRGHEEHADAPQYRRRNGAGEGDYYDGRREGRSHSPKYEQRGYSDERGYAGRGNGRPVDSAPGSTQYSAGSRRRSRDYEQKAAPAPSRVLGIFGMSKYTNEDNLQELFGRFGPVEKIQIIRDPNEGRSRGYAFINMVNVADAQAARDATTGTILHDRKVRVDFSITTKPPRENGGRFSEGRGRDNFRNQRSHHDSRRYDGAPSSHRFQPYGDHDGPYGRRRPNTRDRRRRDEPPRRYPQRDNGRQWGRSKSPRSGHDIYRGSYGQEHQRYGNGAGPRGYEHERQYNRGRSNSRGRAPRGGEYIPAPASTRPPPPY